MRTLLVTEKELEIRKIEMGVTLQRIARRMGVSQVAISQVLKGTLKSPRLRRAVARALQYKPEELWSDYDPTYKGRPRRKK